MIEGQSPGWKEYRNIMEKSKKRQIIIILIVTMVLLLTVGGVYALWSYSKVGPNQELIAGDIYMKYTGTNQINESDMLPIDIGVGEYIINPNMSSEELSSCESYFNDFGFKEGETAKAFCDGTGTSYGDTFQQV